MIRRVNDLEFDGSCVAVTIGLTEIELLAIGYGDNLAPEWVYPMGRQIAVAQTPGQYKTEDGTMRIRSSIAREKLFPNLPQFGAGNALTQAVVNVVHPDLGEDSDALVDFRILGSKASLEASAKALELELKFSYRKVLWTNQRICIGSEDGGFAEGVLTL